MQQMEMPDYVNEKQRCGQKRSGDAKETERRLGQLLFLSFGVLCIIQATLNVALRLTLYSRKESTHLDCNVTNFSDQNQVKEVQMDCRRKRPGEYNRLQDRLNAIIRETSLLENRNTELTNLIKNLENERDRLKLQLRVLASCGNQPERQKPSQLLEPSRCASSQWCPADWKEIDSRCYFLSTESKTWEDSRQYCQSKDADLVVINGEQEQRALYRLDGSGDLLFWIGLYDADGTFKWVDGSALTRPFWQSYQPDRGSPNNREDCVEMYHSNPVLASWNDAPCGAKRRWLCEKDPCTSS